MEGFTSVSAAALLSMEPVPTLIARTRRELSAEFEAGRPLRISRAPAQLDVMGGIAEQTGSIVCKLPIDRAAAVALQPRADRQLQVFSFNLFDEHKPFTFRMPLDALASAPGDAQRREALRRDFDQPGRKWAAPVAGCLFVLHAQGFIDLRDPSIGGMTFSLLSNIPTRAGVGSSAAIAVATMMALRDHFRLTDPAAGRSLRIANQSAIDPLRLAQLCQSARREMTGESDGIANSLASCWGEPGMLLCLRGQPGELLPPLKVPDSVRFIGINSNVIQKASSAARAQARTAAMMGHRILLELMRQMGAAAGRRLVADPMNGYLANLDPDDYKRFFRPRVPESITGAEFVAKYTNAIDAADQPEPDTQYAIQRALDHHVLEARRVRTFAGLIEEASAATDPAKKGFALDRAGHLMYASNLSYSMDAMLGARECDLLVQLVRQHERAGLYGARITNGGCGGTVAVLADTTARADEAIAEIVRDYESRTGRAGEILGGSSAGAWHVGTGSG